MEGYFSDSPMYNSSICDLSDEEVWIITTSFLGSAIMRLYVVFFLANCHANIYLFLDFNKEREALEAGP